MARSTDSTSLLPCAHCATAEPRCGPSDAGYSISCSGCGCFFVRLHEGSARDAWNTRPSTVPETGVYIQSDGEGNRTKIYADGNLQEGNVRSVLLQAGSRNVAWVEIEGVALDVVAEEGESPLEALQLSRALREIQDFIGELENRVATIERWHAAGDGV